MNNKKKETVFFGKILTTPSRILFLIDSSKFHAILRILMSKSSILEPIKPSCFFFFFGLRRLQNAKILRSAILKI